MFSVTGVDVFVVAFAFQVARVGVVAAIFAGAFVTGSVVLLVYGVVAMRKEGNEAEDLPNAIYPSPLRQPFFVSVASWPSWRLDAGISAEQGERWAQVTIVTTTCFVG